MRLRVIETCADLYTTVPITDTRPRPRARQPADFPDSR